MTSHEPITEKDSLRDFKIETRTNGLEAESSEVLRDIAKPMVCRVAISNDSVRDLKNEDCSLESVAEPIVTLR